MHFWPMYISPSGNFLSLFPLHFIFHQCPPVMSYLGLFVYYIMQTQGLETSIILTKEILTNLLWPLIRLSNEALKWVKMVTLLNVCVLSSDLYSILTPSFFFILSIKKIFPGLKISNWDLSLPLSEVSALMYFVSIIIIITIIMKMTNNQ